MGEVKRLHNLSDNQLSELFDEVDEIENTYDISSDMDEDNIIWKPQAGSQSIFLSCPVYECLLTGPRGTGKTDVLLMDFARDCGIGWENFWRGIILRETYKQLSDVIVKSRRWYPKIFPGISFNKSDLVWTWPTGETLMFSYMQGAMDYTSYIGWEIPFQGFEELTNWPTDECYEMMKTCCRSSCPKIIDGRRIPKRIRATTNPYGKGHGWVKRYFINPSEELQITVNNAGQERTWINSNLKENRKLLDVDPEYQKTLESIKDPNKRKAWLEGSWDIVSGGIIGDLWDSKVHVLEPFPIPKQWRVDRAFDWGSSTPFAVGWFAESDGSEVEIREGVFKYFPTGTVILIHEWYGWTGEEDVGLVMPSKEVAKGIITIEKEHKLLRGHKVLPGPADNQIFNNMDGETIASKMTRIKEGRTTVKGITWKRSNKNPGSRINGLEIFRGMVSESLKDLPEEPCFYVFNTCRDGFLRTVPTMSRSDVNPDDAYSGGEDHVWDMVRYRVLSRIHHSTVQEI
jgi:hypothetical protein